jgi:hypothetical protein
VTAFGTWAGLILAIAIPLLTLAVAWGSIQATLTGLAANSRTHEEKLDDLNRRFTYGNAQINRMIVQMQETEQTATRNQNTLEAIVRDVSTVLGRLGMEGYDMPQQDLPPTGTPPLTAFPGPLLQPPPGPDSVPEVPEMPEMPARPGMPEP